MITFNELLKRAKSEKIAIHTPNEEQAKTLLAELDKKGYEWDSKDKLTTETYYGDFKQYTCYDFGTSNLDNGVTCSPLDDYQEEGFTIIEFSDIDFKEDA